MQDTSPNSPDRDLDQLFLQLCDMPAERWQSQLAQLSGDIDVRRKVLQLLEANQNASSDNWLEESPLDDVISYHEPTASFLNGDTSDQKTRRATDLSREPAILREVDGRYEIKQYLGGGTFADVYRAFDRNLKNDVALKVAKRRVTSSEARDAFLDEAATLYQLDSKYIVRVSNADVTAEGQAYIAMEYVAGETLFDYLRKKPQPEFNEIARIMIPVAKAMATAHRKVVHRDLKPGNILISDEGVPKVADFGLAIRDDQPYPKGEYAGTTSYMSPEQIRRESDNLHGSSDRWALGVILYQMLTGKYPFTGKGRELSEAILNKNPKAPRELRPEIPRALEAMVMQCLAKDAADRPTSSLDIAKVLQQVTNPGKQPRYRWQMACVLVGIVCLTLLAVWSSQSSTGDVSTDTGTKNTTARVEEASAGEPPQVEDADLQMVDDIAEIGIPFRLLRRQPKKLLWEAEHQIHEFNYDKPRETLVLDSQSLRLVEIGNTAADDFDLQVAIEKSPPWHGEAGVFWGFKEVSNEEGKKFIVCSAIVVRFDPQEHEFVIYGRSLRFGRLYAMYPDVHTSSFWDHRVATVGGTTCHLEMQFRAGKIKRIYCNRIPIPSEEFDVANFNLAGSQAGALGVINTGGRTQFNGESTHFLRLRGGDERPRDVQQGQVN